MPATWDMEGGLSTVKCKVAPLVVFNILDHYSRRYQGQEGVIGTLLGHIHPGGMVEVTNCFPVFHTVNANQVSVDIEYHKYMFEMHQRVNSTEVVVGWYCTGPELTQDYVTIHSFYGRTVHQPLVVLVNPSIEAVDDFSTRVYVSSNVAMNGKSVGTHFKQVEVVQTVGDSSDYKAAMDVMMKATITPGQDDLSRPIDSDVEQLEQSMEKLRALLDTVTKYAEKKAEGKSDDDSHSALSAPKPTPIQEKQVGRRLQSALSEIPQMGAEEFTAVFNSGIQDLLMVLYLTNLTKAQLVLAEKLKNLT